MPVVTAPARPRTQAAITRLVRDGVQDIAHAAVFLGVCRRRVEYMVSSGEVWSFLHHGKRVIPVVELRRVLAASAAESIITEE